LRPQILGSPNLEEQLQYSIGLFILEPNYTLGEAWVDEQGFLPSNLLVEISTRQNTFTEQLHSGDILDVPALSGDLT